MPLYFVSLPFQNPMILDSSADKENVLRILSKLQARMEELQQRAFLYKSYQKNFKVEVTKYEELEEVHAEMKLKQLLWDSLDEWDNLLQSWMEVSLCSYIFTFICKIICCGLLLNLLLLPVGHVSNSVQKHGLSLVNWVRSNCKANNFYIFFLHCNMLQCKFKDFW